MTVKCKHCDTPYGWVVVDLSTERYMCPNVDCSGKRPAQAVFGIVVKNPETSSKWDNFSYRAGYLMDKAQQERRDAEAKSHMGTNPYPAIDDVTRGGVKLHPDRVAPLCRE
jgi:hypothetical protein